MEGRIMGMKSFRSDSEIDKVLDEIPYGKRSEFIKECIKTAHPEAFDVAEEKPKKSLQPSESPKNRNSPESGGSPTQQTPSSKPEKPSSETAAGANKQNTSSEPNIHNMKKLSNYLSRRGA